MKTDIRLSDRARALALFVNFALVILAYYQIKPASRSLYLEHFSAAELPYAWLASAGILALLMPVYGSIVSRFARVHVVIGSCLIFAFLLMGFRLWLAGPITAIAFYVLTDILSVVLVEQFWSLTNSAFASDQGRRWYGLIGSGGLAGGLVGGQLAASLISYTPLQTIDLLWVAALLILCIALLSLAMARRGLFKEQRGGQIFPGSARDSGDHSWMRNRYLISITMVLLLAQIVEPVVEYQFMHFVQESYPDREIRTAYLSNFFSLLGGLALAVNLLLTPLILRYLGAIGGLLFQPAALIISAIGYAAAPGLLSGATMKIADRGLSYSLNRASKELLYVPVDPALIYKAKAWIDMFGYRAFKVIGAVGILALSQWSGILTDPSDYSPFLIFAAIAWLALVLRLARPYRALTAAEPLQAQANPLR
jgi:AAA family ATP:ADP antiporter